MVQVAFIRLRKLHSFEGPSQDRGKRINDRDDQQQDRQSERQDRARFKSDDRDRRNHRP